MKLTQRVALISLVALLVVAGVWYGVLWRPAQKHLSALRAEQVVAAGNVLSLETQVDALRAAQKQVPKERAALAILDEAVPADPGLDQLIKVLDNAVAEAGMSLTSIGTPAPSGWGSAATASAAAAAGPESIAVSLGVQGSDVELLRLVTDLDSEPRLFVVNSLSLDSAPRASQSPAPSPAASLTGPGAGTGTSSGTTSGTGSATGGATVGASDANSYSVSITAFFVSEASNNPVFPGAALGG